METVADPDASSILASVWRHCWSRVLMAFFRRAHRATDQPTPAPSRPAPGGAIALGGNAGCSDPERSGDSPVVIRPPIAVAAFAVLVIGAGGVGSARLP